MTASGRGRPSYRCLQGRAPIMMAILLILAGLAVMPPGLGPSRTADAQTSDWIIEGKGVVLESEDRIMKKSIIIENGGSLSIRNSTVTFDLTEDGDDGILLKAGGKLTITGSKITSTSALRAPTFESHGALRIERSDVHRIWGTWTDGGGVRILGGEAVLTDSEFTENKRDAVTVYSGSVSILRGTFKNNVVGIRCIGAEGPLIEDNLVSENTQQGILAINSSAIIKLNDVKNNNIGIAFSGSDVNVLYNDVRENMVGIDIADGTRAIVSDNIIVENTDVGIRQTASYSEITDNDISSNGNGAHVTGGEFTASGNTFIGNGRGIVAIGSDGTVRGNEIGGSASYGVYTVGKHMDTTENDWSAPDGKGRTAKAWGFRVNVTKKGAPVEGAAVTITDKEGAIAHTGMTNDSGLTDIFEVVQTVVDNGGEQVSMTPHTVKVSYKKDTGRKNLKVTYNQTLEVTIGKKEASGPKVHVIIAGIGIILMAISVSIGIHLWRTSEDANRPKPKSKRAARGKYRHGRRSAEAGKRSRGGRRHRRRPGRKRRKRR